MTQHLIAQQNEKISPATVRMDGTARPQIIFKNKIR